MAESGTQPENLAKNLTEGLERLLGGAELSGWITAISEGEFPLKGVAAALDWRYHGAISQPISRGSISGKPGECCYIPVIRHDRVHHLFVVGRGLPQSNREIPPESLSALKRNLLALKLPRALGIHEQEIGQGAVNELRKQNLSLWVI